MEAYKEALEKVNLIQRNFHINRWINDTEVAYSPLYHWLVEYINSNYPFRLDYNGMLKRFIALKEAFQGVLKEQDEMAFYGYCVRWNDYFYFPVSTEEQFFDYITKVMDRPNTFRIKIKYLNALQRLGS